MKIQENSNRQPSFGMAFTFTDNAMRQFINKRVVNDFHLASHQLEKMAEDVDITLIKRPFSKGILKIIATPINPGKINNAITRTYYKLRGQDAWNIFKLNKNEAPMEKLLSGAEKAKKDFLNKMSQKKLIK